MRTMPWKRGAAEKATGEVLVALTDFRVHRWRHVPGVWWNGLALRRGWPTQEGAVAQRFWTEPARRRSGSVSVWTSEDALRRFLRSARHRDLAQRYRDRAHLETHKWRAESFDPEAIWADAMRRI
jgi:hypothetical protein